RGTFAHGGNQTAAGASGAVLATVLSAAEGLAVIAFIVVLASARPQRQPKSDDDEELWRPNIPWWAKAAGVLLALAALVTPFAVLLTRKPRQLGPRPLPAGPPKVSLGHGVTSSGSNVWPLIIGMVIAIAVVLALTLPARRRRSARAQPKDRTRLAALLDSLAAGSEALNAGGEPRAAIIACYAAMERGFAAAGSAPAVADTPAEVLARATRAGLVRPEPAETLTGMFRRARYSTHPMTSADSLLAADALTQMRSDLGQSVSQGSRP
ncbi:MAG: DUF4129 domain-containing protein, partial [Streptosporangiaceae bacterium]